MDGVTLNTPMEGFLNNKYTKTYYRIIDRAKTRNNVDGFYETHHIIPKCLGGVDNTINLVKLTPREHYLCHALLPKMVTGQSVYKMYAAFNMMHVGHDGKRYTSHLYEYYKVKFYKKHGANQKGKPRWTEQQKHQMSKVRKGKPWSKNARTVKRSKPTAKPVLAYNKTTGLFVGEWESLSLCAKELRCDATVIWKICEKVPCSKSSTGKMYPLKSHKGYIFRYK